MEPYDTAHRLEFRDYNDPSIAAATPYSVAELAREMHVVTPEGRWLAGYDAWVEVLKAVPKRHRWAAWLSSPSLRWIGPGVYRWIAAHRYRMPGWALRCVDIPSPCDEFCAKKPGQGARDSVSK